MRCPNTNENPYIISIITVHYTCKHQNPVRGAICPYVPAGTVMAKSVGTTAISPGCSSNAVAEHKSSPGAPGDPQTGADALELSFL